MNDRVILEKDGPVATIWLNEPEKRNAFTAEMKVAMYQALSEVSEDPSVRVVVLSGKGTSFSAGGDLKGMKSQENMEALEIKKGMDRTVQMIQKVQEMSKPVIAAVHGYAAGAGFSLALASDLLVAEEDAKFVLAFKNVGLVPDLGGHYFLFRAVGPWKAKEWIWTGRKITGIEGAQHGFVNRVVPRGEAYRSAYEWACELAKGPVSAFAQTKSILRRCAFSDLEDVMEMENMTQSILRKSRDHREGLLAFLEKRDPQF